MLNYLPLKLAWISYVTETPDCRPIWLTGVVAVASVMVAVATIVVAVKEDGDAVTTTTLAALEELVVDSWHCWPRWSQRQQLQDPVPSLPQVWALRRSVLAPV
jgi:hypothetical protein